MKRMRMRTWSHTTMHATRQAWCMVMGIMDDVPPEQLSTSVTAWSTHVRYTIQIRYLQIDRTSTASDAYNKVSRHVRVIMSRTELKWTGR